MARIFKPSKRKLPLPAQLTIAALSNECDGIAYYQKKTVFVPGALPGETVNVNFVGAVKGSLRAQLQSVVNASDDRIKPACQYVDRCGGCALMSVEPKRQPQLKQASVLGSLRQHAGLEPEQVDSAITSSDRGYRSRTRLALRRMGRRWRLGYRAAGSQEIAPINDCLVLSARLRGLLKPLQVWLGGVSSERALGHIELLEDSARGAIVVRSLSDLPDQEIRPLMQLSQDFEVDLWLKEANKPARQLTGNTGPYGYQLNGIRVDFSPEDFTQVNHAVNQAMVARALQWLAQAKPGNLGQVMDLYCGIGNFTLPLAKNADRVVGVELFQSMVAQGQANAKQNGIENALFVGADLSLGRQAIDGLLDESLDVVVLDPPRAGALEVIPTLIEFKVPLLLYVSCNPATMVRDARVLAEAGYRLQRFCVMDMFPQTKHIETMSLFSL